MSSFDELAKVALGEGALSSYMNAVKRAGNVAAKEPIGKKIAKAAIKGAAQVPGRAVQAVGLAAKGLGKIYSAIGGTAGGALLQRAGGAVSAAGQAIAVAPEKIHNAIVAYGQSYEFKTKYLNSYKNYTTSKYPRLKKAIEQAESIDDIENILRKNIPGLKSRDLVAHSAGFFKDKNDPDVNAILAGQSQSQGNTHAGASQQTTSQQSQAAQPQQYQPKLKANRSMVKDPSSGLVYRYLGKNQGGWYIYDPQTKKTDPAPIDSRDQKNVTALWRKKEISNAKNKQATK
jgi:hypothetical protein